MRFLDVAGLAIVVLGASLYSPAQNAKAAEAIRTADQQWLAVFAAKDLDKSVAFVAEDGVVMPPNAPAARGHEDIRTLFAGFFQLPELKVSWQPDQVEIAKSGDWGFSSGTYQMTFKNSLGNLVVDRGKYVTIWGKQSDGSWKVVRDIFNSDIPGPALQ